MGAVVGVDDRAGEAAPGPLSQVEERPVRERKTRDVADVVRVHRLGSEVASDQVGSLRRGRARDSFTRSPSSRSSAVALGTPDVLSDSWCTLRIFAVSLASAACRVARAGAVLPQ